MTFNRLLEKSLKNAGRVLDDDALIRVRQFVCSQLNQDGGFKGRDGRSDLYYTWFGLQCMRSLDIEIPKKEITGFLHSFNPLKLDKIHLAAYVLCKITMQTHRIRKLSIALLYGSVMRSSASSRSIYHHFLTYLAISDLGLPVPRRRHVVQTLATNMTKDGGYSDHPDMTAGTTPVTAAAIILMHYLILPVNRLSAEWLLSQQFSHGGFKANPDAPVPDLLSSATALLALSVLDITLDRKQITGCWEFVEMVWCENGGFSGHVFDEIADVEYTFYGLMCMGLLSRYS